MRSQSRSILRKLPGRRLHIRDRAGARLPLCEPGDLPLIAPREVRDALVRANKARWLPLTWSLIAFWLLVLAYLGQADFRRGRLGAETLLNATGVAAVFGVIGAFLVLVRSGDAAVHGRRALALLLRAHLCPSCCYDLRGATPCPDTLVRCPECGGTWPGPGSPASPV